VDLVDGVGIGVRLTQEIVRTRFFDPSGPALGYVSILGRMKQYITDSDPILCR
jgi:hypothetical protein